MSMVGDCSAEYEKICVEYTDITVDVELYLIDRDGLDSLPAINNICFERLYCYATYLRREDVSQFLDSHYGRGKWQKKYEQHVKNNFDYWSQRIIDAGNRKPLL